MVFAYDRRKVCALPDEIKRSKRKPVKTYTMEINVKKTSSLKGKELVVNYRSDERFIIIEEIYGNRVIVRCNDGCDYIFDLSDDVEIMGL